MNGGGKKVEHDVINGFDGFYVVVSVFVCNNDNNNNGGSIR
jgi:hypothetical protein